MIGTTVAILINVARLPRKKKEHLVFFIRGRDLTPNRFAKISPSVLFHINQLYEDGARICIMLEHAPALFTMQMSSCHLNMPLIVMDGAAIYDASENRYMAVQNICPETSAWLQNWFRSRRINYFTYVINQNRTCIYHDGIMNELEIQVLKQLQRSPYRSYLNGENLCPDEIVYLKVIAKDDALAKISEELEPCLKDQPLRMVIRAQASTPGVSGLYIFSDTAAPEPAKERYMDIMRIKYPDLHPVDIYSRSETYSEHEAAALLHRLRNTYEPVTLPLILKSFRNR